MVFRVAAGTRTGLGHLMRCLALAQAADEAQFPVQFVLDDEAATLAKARHDWHYPVQILPPVLNEVAQGQWLAEFLAQENAAVLVVDGYAFTPVILSAIDREKTAVVVMDDGQQTLSGYADMVVNPATVSLDAAYQAARPGIVCATGSAYRLLRREFALGRVLPIAQRHGLVVSLGGSDPCNLTLPLLKALAQLTQDMPVRVITGAAYPYRRELEDWLSATALPVQHIHNCQDMAAVWQHARLAVSAAGGSQFELGVCQTPAILVVVADNQRNATAQALSEGWCESVNGHDEGVCEALAKRALALYEDTTLLQHMSDNAAGHYDAEGATRVLQKMMELTR
ncbi:UDP-2,4-diacetamido-2,4,6-trideoxy-beta-L-altropyranose hydrolase [Alteromonas sp. CYL-A6]|uniref:UDP-2,4-diacetamido-2,4, 6-trideoxy-beta-L-altropyranose hydrolase n=1 Tax=Alteromonas nitratireducens TaxID=3390813 RepID=UPI0034B2E184